MDIKDIKDLITAIDKTDIERVEIEKNDLRIMISKGSNIQKQDIREDKNPSRMEDMGLEGQDDLKEIEINRDLEDDDNTFIVRSPIVGTFYKASSPDNPPFVRPGDRVSEGQVLCIIEAMKMMNEIEAQEAGEVIEIYVEDEEIVEYDQALMKIRR